MYNTIFSSSGGKNTDPMYWENGLEENGNEQDADYDYGGNPWDDVDDNDMSTN